MFLFQKKEKKAKGGSSLSPKTLAFITDVGLVVGAILALKGLSYVFLNEKA